MDLKLNGCHGSVLIGTDGHNLGLASLLGVSTFGFLVIAHADGSLPLSASALINVHTFFFIINECLVSELVLVGLELPDGKAP